MISSRKGIVRRSAQFASGVAVGGWIYYAVTIGIGAETWYRLVFTFSLLFIASLLFLSLKKALWPQKQ